MNPQALKDFLQRLHSAHLAVMYEVTAREVAVPVRAGVAIDKADKEFSHVLNLVYAYVDTH